MLRIYVISKVSNAGMWRELQANGWLIISTWLNDGVESSIDFSEAWPRYLQEAASATHVMVYAQEGDRLKGGLAEFGDAVSAGAKALVVDYMPPEFRTLQKHPNVHLVGDIGEALKVIKREARLVGRSGERDPDNPCTAFGPLGTKQLRMRPDCDGDGHYLCGECLYFKTKVASE